MSSTECYTIVCDSFPEDANCFREYYFETENLAELFLDLASKVFDYDKKDFSVTKCSIPKIFNNLKDAALDFGIANEIQDSHC